MDTRKREESILDNQESVTPFQEFNPVQPTGMKRISSSSLLPESPFLRDVSFNRDYEERNEEFEPYNESYEESGELQEIEQEFEYEDAADFETDEPANEWENETEEEYDNDMQEAELETAWNFERNDDEFETHVDYEELEETAWNQEWTPQYEQPSLPRTDAPEFIPVNDPLPIAGYTCYVKIDLGPGNYRLNMTGIYFPESFNPKLPVDVVIYLHGMTGYYPGSNARINTYWTSVKLPTFDLRLREEVNAAAKNVVLVAPSLGDSPNAYNNTLSGKAGGLDAYMAKVMAAVNEVIRTRYSAPAIEPAGIILSAHSAGGSQMRKIATLGNPVYGAKITECWGLDCMYGGIDIWFNWAKSNPDKRLFVHYLDSTRGNSVYLCRLSKKLPNVYVYRSTAKNHFWVPKEHMKDRLMNIGISLVKPECARSSKPKPAVKHETAYTAYPDNYLPEYETSARPAAVPAGRAIAFAPEPMGTCYWPVISTVKEGRLVSFQTEDGKTIGHEGRKFLANRTTSTGEPRHHVGIDLFAKFNDPVVACEKGTIVSFKHFYDSKGGHATNSLVVRHPNVLVNYGEVSPASLSRLNLKVGDDVQAGQVIGYVGATNMLHFETYAINNDPGATLPPFRWMKAEPNAPGALLNPTKYLLYLKENGLGANASSAPASSPATTAPKPVATVPASNNWAEAIRLNRYYAQKLGWQTYYNQVNDLLLPYTGLSNVSLSEELFAYAVSNWQKQHGFTGKQADGVIGPGTWKIMSSQLAGTSNAKPAPASPVPAAHSSANVQIIDGVRFVKKKLGWDASGGGKIKEKLDDLRTRGLLSITPNEIDMLSRVSIPESDGKVNSVNSYDSAYMSMGFIQFTMKYHEIQELIRMAPEAFKKYGIELDYPRTWEAGDEKPVAIRNAPRISDLRSLDWAVRFYRAGLETEVIVAQVNLARRILTTLRKNTDPGNYLNRFNDANPALWAFIYESHNSRPGPLKEALKNAIAKAKTDNVYEASAFFRILLKELNTVTYNYYNSPKRKYKSEQEKQDRIKEELDKVKRIMQKTGV